MNIYTIQYKNKETGKTYYIDDMYKLYLEAQEQTEQFTDFDDFLSAVTDRNGLYIIYIEGISAAQAIQGARK